MTYSSGGLIQATDYNGFVSTTAGANVNATWSTGATNAGWGQTALGTVAAGGTVTATQWASLVNTLGSMGSQTGTVITARSAPTAGQTISVLAAVNTDLTNCYNNRGNASASGTQYGTFSGTTSKTTATGSGQTTWTITFTHTVTFASADAARYFFNAGGIVKIQFDKSSVGTDIDPDWNAFAKLPGSINITGGAQTIAGQAYTGTTRLGGSGGTQTTLATSTGWYALTASPVTIFQLNNASSPYTGEYIRTTAAATSSTVLTLITTWVQPAVSAPGTTCNISGGTGIASPSTTPTVANGAPTTLVTYVPPSTTYLTNSWGTPTIAASVA
jgi:hypothetical protein